MNQDVVRIIEIIEFRRAPVPIKAKVVRDWLASDDCNVISAAIDALSMYSQFISPPLSPAEVFEALRKNFELNLATEKQPTVYGTTCYQAARDLYSWLIGIAATNDPIARDLVLALKGFLERAYIAANADARQCIQNGLLEHLFEHEPFRHAFESWRDDPALGEAFRNATRWSEWIKARIAALEEVADRTATLLRGNGFTNACLVMPNVGHAVVSVAWEAGELRFLCDDVWVNLTQQGRIRVDRAIQFTSEPRNWTPDPLHQGVFTIELLGASFRDSEL